MTRLVLVVHTPLAHLYCVNRDFFTAALVAMALHAVLLFGLPVWFRAQPLPAGVSSFTVSLVESSPDALAATPPAHETALPPPPEPIVPVPPPPIIAPPESAPSPPTAVIATVAPSVPLAPLLTPSITPRAAPQQRTTRRAEAGAAMTMDGASAGGGSDTQPRYRSNPPPEYPAEARRLKQQGRVLLDVEVSAEGRAVNVSVKRSSGVAALDEAALRAVRRWRFEPARRAGVPVAARVEVPVQFALAP